MRATVPAPLPAERSSGADAGLELWSWYFFRVSGLLLVFLALGHLVIMHVVNSVDTIDYDWVAGRWRSVGWRIYDWLLLALALPHGFNGLRVVVDDFVHAPSWRRIANATLWTAFIVFLALGTWTIIAFEPGR